MNTKSSTLLLFLVAALLASTARAGTVNISMVPVGDPGNVADPLTGYGSVSYTYSMGEFDVTIGQYCQFLNAVAATDTYGLYNPGMAPGQVFRTLGIAQSGSSGDYSYSVAGSYGQAANCPIFDITWGDSARFVNWLANGEPTGSEGTATTEAGTYTLDGATGTAALMAVTRNPSSTWVLPNVNEWYKSAYYSGGWTNSTYWIYPTQSNAIPSNVLSATGTNNANFVTEDNGPPNYGFTDHVNGLTPVALLPIRRDPTARMTRAATWISGWKPQWVTRTAKPVAGPSEASPRHSTAHLTAIRFRRAPATRLVSASRTCLNLGR